MDKIRKLQLATDFYQFSVSNVYVNTGQADKIAVFDLFIRKNPFKGGYTVFAGLEQIIDFILNLHYTDEDIQMLKLNHPEMTESFLTYLKNFKFSGNIFSVKEGEIIFPYEPFIRVEAPIAQAQLIETTLLTIVNHQTLITTKASRVCEAAGNDPVLDFGLRRAHGTEAGLYGARSAIIGGCVGSSNVEAEYRWNMISKGTMSHAYVMSFEDEYEAFARFAEYNPSSLILLVDTYDTLKSGLPNAIKLFDLLKEQNKLGETYGIRLDSGDLAYLSKQSREMLDMAGHTDAVISASSDLDEYLISDLKAQGAQISLWGVGTKMITAYDSPALGAVYKMSALDGKAKIKISDDPVKITNPGKKELLRFFDKDNDMVIADLITLADEEIDKNKPLRIYHPLFPFKTRIIQNFYVENLLIPIFVEGKLVYDCPILQETAAYHKKSKQQFWKEYRRFVNPNEFHVDLSDRLYDLKKELINLHTKTNNRGGE